ncbi:acyclic terpene utilization AtuA family protein [Pseudohalocynthiibacter sp. F2068]|jgi:Acyclic terpene utilisation family protein AtuA|uniref:acyclic terpene utilization AtuA family protein n=1 Tax=Pseudohalocynthiibacter sp. F2068 TaxID=2926418 RepID=UPI001FF1705F|nr:acyclic terpene utilization AtuA family protein [Pseudohalocynthiibacter sp. F2068]MCK0100688.1 DUF1446 domain-containing protein [Pseudohalocynthiibacter sp. F2068]
MSAFARLAARWPGPDAPLRVLAASGQLGLGIPQMAFQAGVARKPHVIAADMGSIDPGPVYLGSGKMAASPSMARRDLALVLRAARELDVPLLIGSAGTAGGASHLATVESLLRSVAAELGLNFCLATIGADVPQSMVQAAEKEGRLTPIGPMEPDIDCSVAIVGQMGQWAFAKALDSGADVILAGRACDTAPFAVVPVLLGYPKGPSVHMAKILECTSLCCDPGGRDAMMATLKGDGFTLESMNPARAATPMSVAAHALYEQADPTRVFEPEGHVDLSEATYQAVDARRVHVQGAVWHDAASPSVKIEGARFLGHRVVMMAGIADPGFIAASDDILSGVRDAVADLIPSEPDAPWQLFFRRYGIDGVLDWPTPPVTPPREVFILGECVAPDTETARAVAAAARQQLLHWGFPGRLCTGGNLAIPVTPPELDAGPAYAFSLYHILQLDTWEALDALFPVTLHDI